MLNVARSLRMERDREAKLTAQKQEQKNTITHFDQRISRLQNQLKDVRASSVGATPEGTYGVSGLLLGLATVNRQSSPLAKKCRNRPAIPLFKQTSVK
jgi:hypothetical protein